MPPKSSKSKTDLFPPLSSGGCFLILLIGGLEFETNVFGLGLGRLRFTPLLGVGEEVVWEWSGEKESSS